MEITVTIKLDNEEKPTIKKYDVDLGGIQRPDSDRLKILKNPKLAEEDKATEAVMDKLEL